LVNGEWIGLVISVGCVITCLCDGCFAAVFFVGLTEVGLELGHRLLVRWLGSPFITCDGEEVVLVNDEGACADGGSDGDKISAFGGKVHTGLDLFKEGVDGRGRGPRCAHAHCVDGIFVVVDLSVRQLEVVKEELCGDQ